MNFTVCGRNQHPIMKQCVAGLIPALVREGHQLTGDPRCAQFALNCTDIDSPGYVSRSSQSLFVFSFIVVDHPEENLKSVCYNTLVRSLSNLVLCLLPDTNGNIEVYFTTPEAGFYHIPFEPEAVIQRLLVMARSRFATENIIMTDLPACYTQGTPTTEDIRRYGKELEELGVLPTPFPLREILSDDALRHLYRIYGITGASYGNLSAREEMPEFDGLTFWMTGRGVNKAALDIIGKDILLVRGFDHDLGTAYVSVPPGTDPRARVSVDAVEHHMIYTAFPEVGAIVHAHAWIDGVLCTRQNYPCGTNELAREVVDLLGRTGDPASAEVGLKNHGLTITGRNLEEIFGRIRDRLRTQVAMFA